MGRVNRVTVEVRGLRELETKFRRVPRVTEEAAMDGLAACGLVIQSKAKELVQKGPKTGLIYKRRGVMHQASAPGEAPATDQGDLVSSIQMDVEKHNEEVIVSAGTAYARMLEFGTLYVAARSFMQRAVDELRSRLSAIFTQAAQARMRREQW